MLQEKELPGRLYVFIAGSKVTFIHEADTVIDTLIVKYSKPFPLPPQIKVNKFLHYQANSLLFSDTSCRFPKVFRANFLPKYFPLSMLPKCNHKIPALFMYSCSDIKSLILTDAFQMTNTASDLSKVCCFHFLHSFRKLREFCLCSIHIFT